MAQIYTPAANPDGKSGTFTVVIGTPVGVALKGQPTNTQAVLNRVYPDGEWSPMMIGNATVTLTVRNTHHVVAQPGTYAYQVLNAGSENVSIETQ